MKIGWTGLNGFGGAVGTRKLEYTYIFGIMDL